MGELNVFNFKIHNFLHNDGAGSSELLLGKRNTNGNNTRKVVL